MNREELEAYILNHYSTEPDYPWADTPRAAVFRHAGNRKWFALVMEVPRDKLGLAGTEKLDIVNFMHTAVASGSWCGAERQRCGAVGSPLM